MQPLPPKSPPPEPTSSESSESSKTTNSNFYPMLDGVDEFYYGQIPIPPGFLVDDQEPYWAQRKP